jgi:hypothetical protein
MVDWPTTRVRSLPHFLHEGCGDMRGVFSKSLATAALDVQGSDTQHLLSSAFGYVDQPTCASMAQPRRKA